MAASAGVILLTNATVTSAQFDWPGGRSVFMAVCAGWNGATVSLQMVGPDGSTLLDVSPSQTTLTANGGGVVDLPPCQIQATIRGAVPSSGVYASIARVVG